MRIHICLLIFLPLITLYSLTSSAQDIGDDARNAFVRRNSCPNCSSDCYFEYEHPSPVAPNILRVEYIQAESVRSSDGGKTFDIYYKSLNDPSCQSSYCAKNVPGSQLRHDKWSFSAMIDGINGKIKKAGADLNCSVCHVTDLGYVQRIELPVLDKPSDRGFSLEGAQIYLANRRSLVSLDNYGQRYLAAATQDLKDAEDKLKDPTNHNYAVPAATIACLMAQESLWKPSSISNPNSLIRNQFAGLAQCNQDAIDTMLRRLVKPAKGVGAYDENLRKQWDAYMGGVTPEQALRRSSFYRAKENGRPPELSSQDRAFMTRTSIAFVSLSLQKYMNLRLKAVRENRRLGPAVANKLFGSAALHAMAFIAYNAGLGISDDFIPESFYRAGNFSSAALLRSIVRPDGIKPAKMNEVETYINHIRTCQWAPPPPVKKHTKPNGGRC